MTTHCFTVYADKDITVENVKQALIESEMIIQSVCKYDTHESNVMEMIAEELAYDHTVYIIEEVYDYDGIHYKLMDGDTLDGDEFVDRSERLAQAFNCWVRY